MARARVWAVAQVGVDGRLAEVEAQPGGLSGLHVVGLSEVASRESKDRSCGRVVLAVAVEPGRPLAVTHVLGAF